MRDNHDRHLPLQRIDAALNVLRCECNEQVLLECSLAVSRSLVASSSSSRFGCLSSSRAASEVTECFQSAL
jgi:hypothetical protein